jgi:rhomboid protease GluP
MNGSDYSQRQPEIIPPGQDAPIEAPRPRFRFPLTTSLIAINIAVFLLMVFTGVSAVDPTPRDIVRWGANYAPFTLQGQAWRLITSVFLHIGLIHILANMWALWNLGALAEMIFGPKFYLPIYLLTGIAGNIASLAIHRGAPGAGASGAIFGLAGAMISVLKLAPINAPRNAMRGTLRSLLWFAVFNLLFGQAVPGIDNAAHIGGFLCGLILGALLSWSRGVSEASRPLVRWASIAVVAALLFVGFVALKRAYFPGTAPSPAASISRLTLGPPKLLSS